MQVFSEIGSGEVADEDDDQGCLVCHL
jgi:hypothetical protein